jgi:putative transposase
MSVVRYRLLPTPDQDVLLSEHCAQARFVWNLGLEQRNLYRRSWGPTPNAAAQNRQLTEVRATTWLGGGSSTVQQQALRDLDQAFRNWWGGTHQRPTWRKRGIDEGFRIVGPQAKRWERLSRKRARMNIPKVGWVDWRWSRAPGEPKSYRVKRDPAGRWWISFATIPEPVDGPGTGTIVGVDRGVTVPFAMSDGSMVAVPGLDPREKARLLRLQRKLARQVKGSRRRDATKIKIARLKSRETSRRVDVVEKLTTRLATSFDMIRIEDLRIAAMTRSAKGTVDAPGVNVGQKAGLNREILASGWGLFARRLEDKAPGRVEKIAPANTSRRCAVCAHIAKENRKNQAVFECVKCGHRDNADLNAAKNIAAGHAVTARGGKDALVLPLNREPQHCLLSSA